MTTPGEDEKAPLQNGREMPVRADRRIHRTVVDAFSEAVAAAPDRLALRHGDRTLTYRQYGRCVAGLAAHLDQLGASGQRVAILLPNGPEMAVAILAGLSARAQIVLLNPRYKPDELAPLLADADPTVILAEHGAPNLPTASAPARRALVLALGGDNLNLTQWINDPSLDAPSLERPNPGDLATLMYTGGTTGVPKGVVHTHRTLMLTVQAMEYCWPTSTDQADVWAAVAPMSHIWGLLMGVLNPVYGAATVITFPGPFQPDRVIATMERHKVSVFGGGPAAIYSALLAAVRNSSTDLSSLKVCPGGGSPFPMELHRAWQRTMGIGIREAYGMSEAAPITCPRDPSREGSVGRPAPLMEVQIRGLEGQGPLPPNEVGEIYLRAPHMLIGYRNQSESETAFDGGWLRTGDLGRLDEEGYVYIVGRVKDMIIVGGFNVYPLEIDGVLSSHPDVKQAATVGVPDERKGELPVSFIVPAGEGRPDLDTLHRLCSEQLIDYKHPAAIRVVDSIPLTPANKVDSNALRALWSDADAPFRG